MEVYTWIVSAVALLGVWLNIKKNSVCFILWFFTNLSWTLIDYAKGIHAQAVLNYIYAMLSIYGLIEWSLETKRPSKRNAVEATPTPPKPNA